MALAPGQHVAADLDWAHAIAVVEEGEVELVGRCGGTLVVGTGGVISLIGLSWLRNSGASGAVVTEVRRVAGP